jgi:hypothetical protein
MKQIGAIAKIFLGLACVAAFCATQPRPGMFSWRRRVPYSFGPPGLSSAELYDPSTGTFSSSDRENRWCTSDVYSSDFTLVSPSKPAAGEILALIATGLGRPVGRGVVFRQGSRLRGLEPGERRIPTRTCRKSR